MCGRKASAKMLYKYHILAHAELEKLNSNIRKLFDSKSQEKRLR